MPQLTVIQVFSGRRQDSVNPKGYARRVAGHRMTTYSVTRRILALVLRVAVSVIGAPLSARAAGDGKVGVSECHLTLNRRRLSQLLNTTVSTDGGILLPGRLDQGTGQISGVALDAEGQPLADHPVELLGVSEQGAATSVVAAMATNTNGGFSFPGLSQGRYLVDVRAESYRRTGAGRISQRRKQGMRLGRPRLRRQSVTLPKGLTVRQAHVLHVA